MDILAGKDIAAKKIDYTKINIGFLILMYILLFASVRFSSYISLAAICINCLFFFFLPSDLILLDLIFLMPFASIYKYGPGSTSFFTIVELFSLLVLFIRQNCVETKFVLGICILVVYMLFTGFLNDTLEFLTIVKQVMNFAIIYVFVRFFQPEMTKNTLIFYTYGIIFSSVIALFADSFPNFYEYIRMVEGMADGQSFQRFSGLYGDPNYYSVNLILSFCGIILLYHKRLIKWQFWICFVALTALGINTGSKSFLLMFVCVCIMFIISCLICKRYFIGTLFMIFCIVIGLMGLSGRIEMLNNILERIFAADDFNSLTTGRFSLWQSYIEYFSLHIDKLIFGGGLGAPLVNGKGSHNAYIDLFFNYGIVGTILFFYVLYCCFAYGEKSGKRTILNYSATAVILVMYFFLSMLFYFDIAFHFIVAWVIYRMNLQTGKNKGLI